MASGDTPTETQVADAGGRPSVDSNGEPPLTAGVSGTDPPVGATPPTAGGPPGTPDASSVDEQTTEPGEAALGMTARDWFFSALLASVCLVLLAVHWGRLTGWGVRPIEVDRQTPRTFEYHLDLNTATWVELAQLEDIGDVLARRIVADRTERGPFHSVDDLRRVTGIGAKTLEKLRPWIRVSTEP